MSKLDLIFKLKGNYTQINETDLKSKKGYCYYSKFIRTDLTKLQGHLNDNGSYSLLIFQDKDKIEEPVVLPQIPPTPVKISGDEISIDTYDKLSHDEKQNFYPVVEGNYNAGWKTIKYIQKPPTAVKPGQTLKEQFDKLNSNDKLAYYKDIDSFYYLQNTITDETYNSLSEDVKAKYNPELNQIQSGSQFVYRHEIKTTGGRRKKKNTRKHRKSRKNRR